MEDIHNVSNPNVENTGQNRTSYNELWIHCFFNRINHYHSPIYHFQFPTQNTTHTRPNSLPSHLHPHQSTHLPPFPRSTTELTFRLRRLGGNSFVPALYRPCFPRTPVDGSTFHNSHSCSQRMKGVGPSTNEKNTYETGQLREFQLNKVLIYVPVSFVRYSFSKYP